MKTPWTDRVVALHPGFVTGIYVMLFLGSAMLVNISPFASPQTLVVLTGVVFVMMTPWVLWHYSLREAAGRRAAAQVGTRGRKPLLFYILVVTFLLGLALQSVGYIVPLPATARALIYALGAVSVFSCFGAIWTAAVALVRVEERSTSAPFHKTIGTFILEFYLPIGIWALHPRIRRMLAEDIKPLTGQV